MSSKAKTSSKSTANNSNQSATKITTPKTKSVERKNKSNQSATQIKTPSPNYWSPSSSPASLNTMVKQCDRIVAEYLNMKIQIKILKVMILDVHQKNSM